MSKTEITDSLAHDAPPPATNLSADIWAGMAKDNINAASRNGEAHAVGAGGSGASVTELGFPEFAITQGSDGGIADTYGQPLPEKEWTVAIELAATLPNGRGAENQLTQLKLLAEATKNSSVNFVIEAERLTAQNGTMATAEDSRENAHIINEGLRFNKTTPELYLIHDGQVEKLPLSDSIPVGEQDITLLQVASQVTPSKKLGLIIQAHGGGAYGLGTNAGQLSLDDNTMIILAGLAGSAHQKLDLLDFDSCDMGQTAVLKSAKTLADDMVASQGVEYGSSKHDSQNLKAALEALAQNTGMSGRQLGETIVRQADAGANGLGKDDSSPTLTNFDLSKEDNFEQALNKFGAALNTVDQNADNMAVLHHQIDATTKLQHSSIDSNKDLRSFVEGVQVDIRSGQFYGDTTTLDMAAKKLLASMDEMITANHSDQGKLPGKTGGIDTPLPGSEILSSSQIASTLSPLNMLANAVDSAIAYDDKGPPMSSQERLVEGVGDLLWQARKMESGKKDPMIDRMEDDLIKLCMSQTPEDMKSALILLQADVHAAQHGETGAAVSDTALTRAPSVQKEVLQQPQPSVGSDWDEFIRRVQAGADSLGNTSEGF